MLRRNLLQQQLLRRNLLRRLYRVKAQTSLAPLSWFHGSRVLYCACAPMLLCEDCAVANEIDMKLTDAWTNIHGIHDKGPRDPDGWRLTLTAYCSGDKCSGDNCSYDKCSCDNYSSDKCSVWGDNCSDDNCSPNDAGAIIAWAFQYRRSNNRWRYCRRATVVGVNFAGAIVAGAFVPGGGGAPSVIEGDRGRAAGQGMILPVINIGTGYQIGLMWSSPLTQGIKSA